jgi:hypothetical protein
VKLRTPVATIGVRGTEFLVHVDRDEATIIDILEGSVDATPHGSGKPITCIGGQSILIASENEDAVCGDIGSFSTAAGPGNSGNDNDGGQRGADKKQGTEVAASPPEPEPTPDPGCQGDDCGGGGGNDHECPGGWGDYPDYPNYYDQFGPSARSAEATTESTGDTSQPEQKNTAGSVGLGGGGRK